MNRFCGSGRLPGVVNRRCCAVQTDTGAKRVTHVPTTELKFWKYQGIGNDFILVDNRKSHQPLVTSEQAVQLCDRHFGVGADGVIFALPPEGEADFSMRIFNGDGSEPEMCGNGIRCLAKFYSELTGEESKKYKVHTLAGLMLPELLPDGQVRVDMGEPILEGKLVPVILDPTRQEMVVAQSLDVAESQWTVTAVSMGNPHAVIYTRDGEMVKIDDIDLPLLGPQFENHSAFPARINTEFVEVLSRNHVRMCVWERGAGRTLACGTGACALVVAGVLEGRIDRKCLVDLPGGPLDIYWSSEDNHVYMTGPAEVSFSGTISL